MLGAAQCENPVMGEIAQQVECKDVTSRPPPTLAGRGGPQLAMRSPEERTIPRSIRLPANTKGTAGSQFPNIPRGGGISPSTPVKCFGSDSFSVGDKGPLCWKT